MRHKCNDCKEFFIIQPKYNADDNRVILEIPEICIRNGQHICLMTDTTELCCDFKAAGVCASEVPVYVRMPKTVPGDPPTTDNILFAMQTEHCTAVYANTLHCKCTYHFTVATDTKVFCCHDKHAQCNFEHQFPVI